MQKFPEGQSAVESSPLNGASMAPFLRLDERHGRGVRKNI